MTRLRTFALPLVSRAVDRELSSIDGRSQTRTYWHSNLSDATSSDMCSHFEHQRLYGSLLNHPFKASSNPRI